MELLVIREKEFRKRHRVQGESVDFPYRVRFRAAGESHKRPGGTYRRLRAVLAKVFEAREGSRTFLDFVKKEQVRAVVYFRIEIKFDKGKEHIRSDRSLKELCSCGVLLKVQIVELRKLPPTEFAQKMRFPGLSCAIEKQRFSIFHRSPLDQLIVQKAFHTEKNTPEKALCQIY